MTLLTILELILSGAFIFYFLTGVTDEYVLGGLMAAQLLVVSLVIIIYYRISVTFIELSEDREEAYLW